MKSAATSVAGAKNFTELPDLGQDADRSSLGFLRLLKGLPRQLQSPDCITRAMELGQLAPPLGQPTLSRLTITLFIIGPMPKNAFAEPKKLDSDYMLELSVSVNWKRGVKMRPVKSFRELTASESQPPDFAASLHVRQCWVYEFVVEDIDVPLTG